LFSFQLALNCFVQLRQLSGSSATDFASASASSSTSAGSQDVDAKDDSSKDDSLMSALKDDEERELERDRERGRSDSDIIRDLKLELK